MKILTLYYTHKPGGYCKRLYRMITALSSAGHQVTYLCLDVPPIGSIPDGVYCQIPFPLNFRSGLLFWILFSAWLPVFVVYKSVRLKTQRIAVFGTYYATASAPAAMFNKAKIILFIRRLAKPAASLMTNSKIQELSTYFFEKVGCQSASKIICMTENMKQNLPKSVLEKTDIEIIPNDIRSQTTTDNQEIPPVFDGDAFFIFMAGTIDKVKNISLLIDTAKILRDRNLENEYHFIIAGEGKERPILEAKSEGWKNVSFVGWVADINPFLKNADLYIQPTLSEGMSNSMLEALGAGLPVLASDIGENRELLQLSELLIDPQSPEALADILSELKNKKWDLSTLKDLCEPIAKSLKFDWDSRVVEAVTD